MCLAGVSSGPGLVGQLEMRLDHVGHIDEQRGGALLAVVLDRRCRALLSMPARMAALGACGADLGADLVAAERLEADRLQHVDAVDRPRRSPASSGSASRMPRAADGVITS